MAGELAADRPVDWALVGHQITGLVAVGGDDRLEGGGGDVRDMEAADPALPLDQREDRSLGWDPALPIRGYAADESFIYLEHFVLTTERAAVVSQAAIGHGLADAMPEEPCRLHAALKGSLDLARCEAFLRGAEQVDDLKPDVQRHMARLE